MTQTESGKTGCVRLEKDAGSGWSRSTSPLSNALTAAIWRSVPLVVAAPKLTMPPSYHGTRRRKAFSSCRHFRTGHGSRREAASDYDALNQAAFDVLSGAGKPVIAMIEGFGLGGGLTLRRTGAQAMESLLAPAERCITGEDYAEGRRAFKQKRKPEFKGR
jgi:hypothetical protein